MEMKYQVSDRNWKQPFINISLYALILCILMYYSIAHTFPYNWPHLMVQMYVGALFMNGLAVLISNNLKLSSVSVHLFHHTCELLVIMNGLLSRRRQGCSLEMINHSEER